MHLARYNSEKCGCKKDKPMAQSGAVVMVVDDDIMNRELMQTVLTRSGYRVVEASSGAQALSAIATAPPDVVLLDVRLGDMSGYEVCAQLKENPATSALPVIIFTAFENQSERANAMDAGADAFVSRMEGWQAIVAKIAELLR
jgi:CheY-like chemotaxis protein